MDAALSSALRKAGWRLIPLLVATYVLNYLDRTCIGFAALTMNRDIGLSATQFGFGAGMFFVSYCLCEIPSNAALYRFGARRWLSRIMITWGLASAATAFVTGPNSFYLIRFLLGAAEAGYFPGVIYFLGAWFPAAQRTRFVATMLLGIPISSVIGGPVCGLLLQMDGALGLQGWKWLFLVLSLPCVALGFVALKVLSDSPESAGWLSDDERTALAAAMAGETRDKPKARFWGAFGDPRVLILAGVQFGFTLGSYAIGIWLPLILKEFRLADLTIGFLAAAPYVFASAGMLWWAFEVDRRGHRIVNVAVGCILSVLGLVAAVWTSHSLWLSLAALTVSLIGLNAARAIFWTIPARFLVGAGAAGGLAFINSIGTVGGFVGPVMMGWLKDATGSFQTGIGTLAGIMAVAGALALSLKLLMRRE